MRCWSHFILAIACFILGMARRTPRVVLCWVLCCHMLRFLLGCAQVLEALLGEGFAGVSWGLKRREGDIQVCWPPLHPCCEPVCL
jgi:hypothetical protein